MSGLNPIERTEQQLMNQAYDPDNNVHKVASVEFNGTEFVKPISSILSKKITTVGDVTYIGKATPGTAQSAAAWQCKKIDSSVAGTTIITWAGSGAFNQVATDLTVLTYS